MKQAQFARPRACLQGLLKELLETLRPCSKLRQHLLHSVPT